MAGAHRFAPGDLERIEETIARLGSTVTIGLLPTETYLGGRMWTIYVGSAAEDGYGEGGSLADAIADLGTSASETA